MHSLTSRFSDSDGFALVQPGFDMSDSIVLQSISTALQDPAAVEFVKKIFTRHYKNFFNSDFSEQMLSSAFDLLVDSQRPVADESKLRNALLTISSEVYNTKKNKKFFHSYSNYKSKLKPAHCFNLVSGDLVGHRILDFGSGNGYLSKVIKDHGYSVIGADILDYSLLNTTQIPFVQLERLSDIRNNINNVDTTVVVTVLHHVKDEILMSVLKELSSITKRMIIIEDVIDPEFFKNNPSKDSLIRMLAELSLNSRGNSIILGDFYGNVVTQKLTSMKLPFNFKTTSDWIEVLSNCGFTTKATSQVGFSEVSFHGFYQVKIVCDSTF